MSKEESTQVSRLLAPASDTAAQRSALKWIGEYLEEGYILNLRPSTETLAALLKVSQSGRFDPTLRKRAAALHKKYRPLR